VLLVPRRLAHGFDSKVALASTAVRELLRDLYGHQEWADALHWTAFAAHPLALQDPKLRERLHHIHLVQRAFLAVARRTGPPAKPRLEDFASVDELKAEARRTHEDARRFVEEADDDALAARVSLPWFQGSAARHLSRAGSASVRDAQPLPPRPERDAPQGAGRLAAAQRSDRVVVEGPSSGLWP
jgi:hypothetical protein